MAGVPAPTADAAEAVTLPAAVLATWMLKEQVIVPPAGTATALPQSAAVDAAVPAMLAVTAVYGQEKKVESGKKAKPLKLVFQLPVMLFLVPLQVTM